MRNLLPWAAGCCLLFSCNNPSTTTPSKDTAAAASATPATPPQSEFADARYTDMGKKMLAQFASGDITGWLDNFADNAVYQWSSGDSLAGRTAMTNYWKDRRGKVIDSIEFVNDIWLPMKVNRPQKGPDIPGIWLLGWYEVHVKYKNGKRLGFWVHHDCHFNDADKIDRYIQYIDMAPINKAVGH